MEEGEGAGRAPESLARKGSSLGAARLQKALATGFGQVWEVLELKTGGSIQREGALWVEQGEGSTEQREGQTGGQERNQYRAGRRRGMAGEGRSYLRVGPLASLPE